MMDSALAAIIGAAVGASASVAVIIIQQIYQGKRDFLRMAVDLSIEDYKTRLETVRKMGGAMSPISAFVCYHLKVLEEMSKNNFSPDVIRKLSKENDEILSAYFKLSDERGNKSREE